MFLISEPWTFIRLLTVITQNIRTPLTLACWVIMSAGDILEKKSCFSQKIGFDTSCKLSPMDNLHEVSNLIFMKPIFWEK